MRPPAPHRGGRPERRPADRAGDDAGQRGVGGGAVAQRQSQQRRGGHREDRHRGVGGGLGGDGFTQPLADPGQPGGQRLVLGFERFPVDGGRQHQGVAVFDAQIVEGLGDVESDPVGLVQFVADIGIQPTQPAPGQLVVEQLDDVVDERLDRHRRRVHLRDQVRPAHHRDRAARRKRDFRHLGRSASGMYLSATAAVISNSRSRLFRRSSCWVSMIPPLARCGS
ncbi:hypothetical protein C1Y40_00177 [Mycobacterium talmoniae]|uniref:Uncharacterized protein n=1 Tax=Mycobacterium talmoniae TaxID=1858794 RepID=A0A2S8BSD5_9MYCO|nr:hypothetical protein C1Y40_00177 [Mycobacterium talmoniae]